VNNSFDDSDDGVSDLDLDLECLFKKLLIYKDDDLFDNEDLFNNKERYLPKYYLAAQADLNIE
jgi:hypothetical protein